MERPKLLLADDSVTIQRVVNLTFADEGIDVIAVGDGDAALREIASVRPDIVLADVHMPGPTGYEICSLLRGIEETANVPVILLVGSFEPFNPELAESSGADAFVTKPFQSIRQLVDQVRELLQKSTSNGAAIAAPNAEAEGPVLSEEEPPQPKELDTTDIDSLYEESFAETVEIRRDFPAEDPAFTSDRLDDEIIETSYTAEQPNELVDHMNTNSAQFEDVSEPASGVYSEPLNGSSAPDEVHASSYEETLQMDLPPIQMTQEHQEPSVHNAPTEEFRRDPFATTTDSFDLDDLDLLDLSVSQVDEQYTLGTPTQSVEDGSHKQVVSISPELLDIIVRKVVEKLSEKY